MVTTESRIRVLIHNSDSPQNRGDRAILVGVIELVRRRWPDAEIWSLSQFAERDAAWYGINFLPQSPYSTKLGDWAKLFGLARRSDIVLWGGGEILKDYTNKLGLVYWLVKLKFLKLANRTIVGSFQGIGPTSASISKWLIRHAIDTTRAFVVRDQESKTKLEAWGARTRIIASFDPAVLGTPSPFDADLEARLAASADVDAAFLAGAVGLGLRPWFHYRQSGWLPYRFRRRPAAGMVDDGRLDEYRSVVAAFADDQVEKHGRNVVFFPMHMEASEGDAEFAASIVRLMRNPQRTRIVAEDVFSSNDYAGILGELPVFVASRLHSSILSTLAGVPSCVYYYVDKGRLYFEQLGMQRFSAPIERLLEPGAGAELEERVSTLVTERTAVRAELATSIAAMSTRLESDFASAIDALDDPRLSPESTRP